MSVNTKLAPKALGTSLRGLSPLVLFAMAFVILSTMAVSARAWLRPATRVVELAISPVKATTPAQPSAAPQSNSQDQALEAEVVTIRRSGFEPQQLTRPRGRFILMIENRSGLGDVDLQLEGETGNSLRSAHMPEEQLDWHDEFDLVPGNYMLTDAGHPDWACRITITEQ